MDHQNGNPGARASATGAYRLSVAKDAAQWFIPSSYCAEDARSHEAQRAHGQFWFLPIDIDQSNLALADVHDSVKAVIGDVAALACSTSSATADIRKAVS